MSEKIVFSIQSAPCPIFKFGVSQNSLIWCPGYGK